MRLPRAPASPGPRGPGPSAPSCSRAPPSWPSWPWPGSPRARRRAARRQRSCWATPPWRPVSSRPRRRRRPGPRRAGTVSLPGTGGCGLLDFTKRRVYRRPPERRLHHGRLVQGLRDRLRVSERDCVGQLYLQRPAPGLVVYAWCSPIWAGRLLSRVHPDWRMVQLSASGSKSSATTRSTSAPSRDTGSRRAETRKRPGTIPVSPV